MKSLILSLASILIFSCNNKSLNKNMSEFNHPPKVKQIPKELKIHGDVRIDEFYWLNDRKNPEVIDYLNKENDYYNLETEHTKIFQKDLFQEMKSRIKKDDMSVPYKFNGYWYITKFEKGKDYPIYIRKKESLDSKEELLFDCNIMAKNRVKGLEYSISHFEDAFYIVSNTDNAQNFKLSKTSEKNTEKTNWIDVIPHRENVLLEGIDIFKDFLVISERENGLNKIKISRWDNSSSYYLPFNSETYTAYTTTNIDFETSKLRYSYQSLTTPSSVVEFDMITKEKNVLKEQEVLDVNFNKENYISKRLWASASDGTKIPISLVHHKNTKINSNTPLLQYAYGSYGSTIDPYFSTVRLSLLDRGFVYAIAHIRGGEYMGRQWYENGKLFKKKNSFTDFIDTSNFLIENNYTSPKHLYAMGGSAGGLLMGAVINMAPDLYNGVVAQVPFVDVVTTMLDEDIPLTTGEYDEWGNPNDKDYYEYMLSYSPYDNISNKNYPNLLVTTGLYDSQVQYWEPAKWVARLRSLSKNTSKLYLHTNMDAGHGGSSGRFESLKEIASVYAFIFDLESINQ